MDLSGQLHNLPKPLELSLSLPVPAASEVSARVVKPWIRQRRLGDVRDAMVAVLGEDGGYLRVSETTIAS